MARLRRSAQPPSAWFSQNFSHGLGVSSIDTPRGTVRNLARVCHGPMRPTDTEACGQTSGMQENLFSDWLGSISDSAGVAMRRDVDVTGGRLMSATSEAAVSVARDGDGSDDTSGASVAASDVHDVLGQHLLRDGFKLVFDPPASSGSWLVD